ncbi:prolyl endopeptidase-like isoform X1 [Hibiscus syriacus]|uniref:Prolyl endopeptidase-like isoform X1 n=1 Tax=Hibiscus syriacus TaxID=106335 RepID=A0A6A2ZWY7_HIBSY|nr:prolyl endopeptidase-like isoform X1 [Hibiscus syriacus]
MALAQQNNWHVLLDAGSLGPKDMNSLGLSLFRPDLIITSFYRVFGHDPTGFGCLLIKKSVMGSLQNWSGSTGSGMVKITLEYPLYLSGPVDDLDVLGEIEDNEVGPNGDKPSENRPETHLPAFSGAYTPAQVQDIYETEMDLDSSTDRDGASTIFEETQSISFGEMMKSPIFSEDESLDNSFWIDLGQSPLGSDNAGQLNNRKYPRLCHHFVLVAGRATSCSLRSQHQPYIAARYMMIKIFLSGMAIIMCYHLMMLFNQFQELDLGKDNPSEAQFARTSITPRNHKKASDRTHLLEIQEEQGTSKSLSVESVSNSSVFRNNGLTSENSSEIKDNVIRRETEGRFPLLGRREGNKYNGCRFLGLEDEDPNRGRRVSFSIEDSHKEHMSRSLEAGEASGTSLDNEDISSDGEHGDGQDWEKGEPEITCRNLDHFNMLGLNKTTLRLRFFD